MRWFDIGQGSTKYERLMRYFPFGWGNYKHENKIDIVVAKLCCHTNLIFHRLYAYARCNTNRFIVNKDAPTGSNSARNLRQAFSNCLHEVYFFRKRYSHVNDIFTLEMHMRWFEKEFSNMRWWSLKQQ
jgi:hypothetical protein